MFIMFRFDITCYLSVVGAFQAEELKETKKPTLSIRLQLAPNKTPTDLNAVRSDVERSHQALQEVSDPSEVGASDAPGAVHQQHDVRCRVAGALEWSPW